MKRDFDKWFNKFKESIAGYDYYIDFSKVINNVEKYKDELNILNVLIGAKDIENEFDRIINKYPETLKCIPLLLAVRQYEIYAQDDDGKFLYNFRSMNYPIEQYKVFMRKTGLFDMLQNHIINNLLDYALGVETGLDSNGRKNRGGHLMEDLVEKYIQDAGFIKDENYFKEMTTKRIQKIYGLDLSKLSFKGETVKRFDFVIKTKDCLYGIETNFYASKGSKLNETARSYFALANEAEKIKGFKFIWFTDGIIGWKNAKNNLKDTYYSMEHLYSIDDMENGIISKIVI